MNTHKQATLEGWDELDALFAAGLEPLSQVSAPPRAWKRLVRHLMGARGAWSGLRLWLLGWGTPQLVSPYAPQPLAGKAAGWLTPPIVGAMAVRLSAQRLTC